MRQRKGRKRVRTEKKPKKMISWERKRNKSVAWTGRYCIVRIEQRKKEKNCDGTRTGTRRVRLGKERKEKGPNLKGKVGKW
jgi:hypothetical protein